MNTPGRQVRESDVVIVDCGPTGLVLGCVGNQCDDDEQAGQRPGPQVLRDVTEHAVLDPRLRGDKPCSTSMSPAGSGTPG